jgi:hypothetical protein
MLRRWMNMKREITKSMKVCLLWYVCRHGIHNTYLYRAKERKVIRMSEVTKSVKVSQRACSLISCIGYCVPLLSSYPGSLHKCCKSCLLQFLCPPPPPRDLSLHAAYARQLNFCAPLLIWVKSGITCVSWLAADEGPDPFGRPPLFIYINHQRLQLVDSALNM